MASIGRPFSPVIHRANVATDGLEDIRYLLTLETYKRYKDDEANIRRQVEEKMRQHKFQMREYLRWYAKFVKLVKLCEMRKALEQKNPLDNELVELTKANILQVAEKITNGALSDYLDPKELEICQQNLTQVKSNDNLNKLQQEVAEIKAAVFAIQTAIEAVEANVEKSVMQGLDYFVAELQMENFKE